MLALLSSWHSDGVTRLKVNWNWTHPVHSSHHPSFRSLKLERAEQGRADHTRPSSLPPSPLPATSVWCPTGGALPYIHPHCSHPTLPHTYHDNSSGPQGFLPPSQSWHISLGGDCNQTRATGAGHMSGVLVKMSFGWHGAWWLLSLGRWVEHTKLDQRC